MRLIKEPIWSMLPDCEEGEREEPQWIKRHSPFHCSHERLTLPEPSVETFRDRPQNFQLWRREKALCESTLGINSPFTHTGHLSGSPRYPGARASGLQTDPYPSVPAKEPAALCESLSACHPAEDSSLCPCPLARVPRWPAINSHFS